MGVSGQESLENIRSLLASDGRLREDVERVHPQWEGRIFSVETLDVRLPDGDRGVREIVRHHGGAGVCAVENGRICLVRQWRVALDEMTLEIPAGKLEEGEDPAACAARELTEETGLIADGLELIAYSAGAPGFTNEATRIFRATGLRRGSSHPDEGEFVDVVWLPVPDVAEAIAQGLIKDAKTIVATLDAARRLNIT